MIDLLKKVVHLASGDRRWPWVVLVGLAVLVSGIEALSAVVIVGVLGLLGNGDITIPLLGDVGRFFDGGSEGQVIVRAAIILATFFFVRACLVTLLSYVTARVTQSAGARLSARLHRGYLSMSYLQHLQVNSSVQIRNAHDAVGRIVADVFVQGARATSELIVSAALILLLTIAAPLPMAMVAAIMVPTLFLMTRVLRPHLEVLGRQTHELTARSLQFLQESLHGFREIKVARKEGYFADHFASIRYALARTKTRRSVAGNLPSTVLEMIIAWVIAAFLAIAVISDRDPDVILPLLGMFAYVGLRLKPSLNQIVEGVNSLRYSSPTVDDVYGDLRRAETWTQSEGGEERLEVLGRNLRLNSVTFSYPGSARPALRDLSISIEDGTSVGFVGPSGGGKSTLLDLVVGLLEPQEGQLVVDDVLQPWTRGDGWFSQFGIVPQTTFLLDASIRRNIALGIAAAHIDESTLTRVITQAELDHFVGQLPDGLDSVLGERGLKISGGQRQRISIARALYLAPKILVLDEGTAALDHATEAKVLENLKRDTEVSTMLIVAHRLSTVRGCDIIHVVEDGGISSSGTFDELMVKSPFFQKLNSASA